MTRLARFKVAGHAAGYHVISCTNHKRYLLDDDMKSYFVFLLKKMKKLYYVKYAGFTILNNHYHLLLQFADQDSIDPYDAVVRWNAYHDVPYTKNPGVEEYREYVVEQLTDVSSFMKRFNHALTVKYNQLHQEEGTLWKERFHSTVVQRGWAFVNCAAYIELNAFRASIVSCPEDYKHSSLNMLCSGNSDGLIDVDLLEEGLNVGRMFEHVSDSKAYSAEIIRTYLAFIYKAGTSPHRDKNGLPEKDGIVISSEMQDDLAKYGIKVQEGSLAERLVQYSKGKFAGGGDFVRGFYYEHFDLGYTGDAAARHYNGWMNGAGSGVFSLVCKSRYKEKKKQHENRGSP